MKLKNKGIQKILYWVLALAILTIIGAALNIIDRIAKIPAPFWCVYYGLWAAAVALLAVRPALRTMSAPPVRGIGREEITRDTKNLASITSGLKSLWEKDTSAYSAYADRILAAIPLTPEEREQKARIKNTDPDEIALIGGIIHSRYQEMREIIKNAAVANFAVTTVSQNAVTDFLSSVIININMIDELVRSAGGGPSAAQKVKLYARMALDAFLVTKLDDVVSNLPPLKNLGPLNILLSSVINGAMNAFVSLRIGYTVIAYLEKGSEDYNPEEAKKTARSSARAEISAVVGEGVRQTTQKLGDTVAGVL